MHLIAENLGNYKTVFGGELFEECYVNMSKSLKPGKLTNEFVLELVTDCTYKHLLIV